MRKNPYRKFIQTCGWVNGGSIALALILALLAIFLKDAQIALLIAACVFACAGVVFLYYCLEKHSREYERNYVAFKFA